MSTEEESHTISSEEIDNVINEAKEELKKLSAENNRVFELYQKAVTYEDKAFYGKRFEETNKAVLDCSMQVDWLEGFKRFNEFAKTEKGKKFLKLKKKEYEERKKNEQQ